jgi:hypothetical protein
VHLVDVSLSRKIGDVLKVGVKQFGSVVERDKFDLFGANWAKGVAGTAQRKTRRARSVGGRSLGLIHNESP